MVCCNHWNGSCNHWNGSCNHWNGSAPWPKLNFNFVFVYIRCFFFYFFATRLEQMHTIQVGAPAPSAIPKTNCPISMSLGLSGISQRSFFPWILSRQSGQVSFTSLLLWENINDVVESLEHPRLRKILKMNSPPKPSGLSGQTIIYCIVSVAWSHWE